MSNFLDFRGKDNTTGNKISGIAYLGNITDEQTDFLFDFAFNNPREPRQYQSVVYKNLAHFFQENIDWFNIYDEDVVGEDGLVNRNNDWVDVDISVVFISFIDYNNRVDF